MEIEGLEAIDWSAPWFAPIAELGRRAAASGDWRDTLNRAAADADIRNSNCHRITFCAAAAAADEPYEAFMARTGCVPTRANLHDFFNALVFIHFPQAKTQLNRLQAAAIARDGVGAVRGALRDAATLLDENAVLLVTLRTDVVESLRAHDWTVLFLHQRAAWTTDVSVLAFGHALLQKLTRPYKAVTAHALPIALASDSPLDEIDRAMAAIVDEELTSADLMPLPVLGIPGWCRQNNDADFYSDPAVFRPAKMRPDRKAETDS